VSLALFISLLTGSHEFTVNGMKSQMTVCLGDGGGLALALLQLYEVNLQVKLCHFILRRLLLLM